MRTSPRFRKYNHHVVPASWQRRFASTADPGPYYKNVVTGACLPAQGPGQKMAEEYVNTVFDEFFRPSDALEDRLSTIETKAIPALDRTLSQSVMDPDARAALAYFLAIQACRYPDLFQERLDHGRFLGIALLDFAVYKDVDAVNEALKSTGLLPGAAITQREFDQLKRTPASDLDRELEYVLRLHGYEVDFNPELILDGAIVAAEHLLALHWRLVESPASAFILSDRPVPRRINYGFSVGLGARFALQITKPHAPVDELPIRAVPATPEDIRAINSEVRSRAREWICGGGTWVHAL